MSTDLDSRPAATSVWLVDRIRHAIIEGEIPSRAPLRQAEIAARYHVSRMPVREALQRLEAEGWVIHTPHKGAHVAPLDAGDLRDLFAIREAVESLAARRRLPALTLEQIAQARHALAALEAATGDAWFAAHKAFHLSLYAAAGPRLQRLAAQQLDAAERYLRLENAILDVAEKDCREHRALLDAAIMRDGPRAVRILQTHVGETGENLAARLEITDGGARG